MVNKTKPTRRNPWQRFGLITFFALFALSGILRLGTLNLAFASTSDSGEMGHVMPEASHDTGQCASLEPLEIALARVEGRAEALDERDTLLENRADAVAHAEVMVAAQLAALEEAEARLQELLSFSDTAAEADLERLTQVYETMDAADAAALFAQMDPSFAAGFLGRMNSDAAAGVFADLDPAVAYSISVLLATRNASAPLVTTPARP